MMWTILFNCLVTLICLYLWWLIFFCSFFAEDNNDWKGCWKKGDKIKFPLWKLVISFPMLFIPGINIGMLLIEIFYISYLKDTKKADFKSFLFKKI